MASAVCWALWVAALAVGARGAEVEREALVALRQAITGDPTGALSSWGSANSSSYCAWEGVTCHPGSAEQVKSIDLAGRRLLGSITPLLGMLPNLSLLNLSFNQLGGPVPAELGNCSTLQKLALNDNQLEGGLQGLVSRYSNRTSQLRVLWAGGNNLTGDVPAHICRALPGLRQLNLSGNELHGQLSGALDLAGCSRLHLLDLSLNAFDGPLPALAVANLSRLGYLDLSSNQLASSPATDPFLANASLLAHLDLSSNHLSGPIPPAWILLLRRLAFLSLGRNSFTGTLPPSIASLPSLSYLQLESNHLHGQPLRLLLNCSTLAFLALTNNSFAEELPPTLGSSLPSISILVLIFNNFFGSIPPSLGNCSSLQVLILGFNYAIAGPIPPQLFRSTRSLQHLDLQYNSLQGSIPPQIGANRSTSVLARLLLNNNYLSGNLPRQLGNLAQLQQVTLEYNGFSGGIPEELGNYTKLIVFSANRNLLTGRIPPTFGRLSVIEHLILDNNRLLGTIPPSLSNCTRLTNVSLNSNLLEGGVLAATLPSMLYFDLSNNRLAGPIPSQLGSMIHVQIMDLSFNALSGSIPASLVGCVNLYALNLSSNNLSGSIPAPLGVSLQSLLDLNLSGNALSGQIPQDFGNLSLLRHLDLSFNSLSGEIPGSLAMLANLSFLNVSYNMLEGPIPDTGTFRAFSPSSFLGNPGLCSDPILGRPCPKHRDKLSPLHILIIIVGAVLFPLILAAVVLAFSWRRMKKRRDASSLTWGSFSPPGFVALTLKDIKEATRDFDKGNVLGSGGSGTVYKGTTKDGQVLAFKRLLLSRDSPESPFFAEVKAMGNVRHRNLVKIMGYFYDLDHDILILEYISNGNLGDRLHNRATQASGVSLGAGAGAGLPWEDRLRIVRGIAEGLAYLHHASPTVIVHLDVKPANILLDGNMDARISDFGLARFMREANTHSSTQNMRGSLGYLAPEYASLGQISTKCDVYSFGIVLMEIITWKSPDDEIFDEGNTLTSWVRSSMSSSDQRDFLNLCMGNQHVNAHQTNQVITLLEIAMLCTKENPKERPTMKNVVDMLEELTRSSTDPTNNPLKRILSHGT